MAFATKYKVTWFDVEDIEWEVDFQEDGFGGSVTEFTPGANPLVMTWHGSDKYQPIVGSSVDVEMVYESGIDSLYTETSQDIRVVIQRDSSAWWYGFVSPGQYYRAFNKPVHYATITATDNLGELKNIKFEDGSGDPYFGQQTEMTAISNILQKTGLQLGIIDAVNIFDTNQTKGADKSPLNQTYFFPEAYWDEETDERANCYTVLSDILKKYGATVRQPNATWHILRLNSFSVDTIYYRSFTYLGVYSSNNSYSNLKSIDANFYYMYSDQEVRKQTGIGTCEVTQDPPRRTNMIRNGSFDSFTWTGGVPDYWDDVYSSGTTLDISEDNDQLKMGACGNSSVPTEYIEMTVLVDFAKTVNMSFDWTPTYTGSPTFKSLYIQVYSVTFSKYLASGAWQAGVGYVSFAAGSSGTEIRETFEIPDDGNGFGRGNTLRIRIYEFYCEQVPADNYFHLNNLKMEVDMDKPEIRLHSYDNASTINNIDKREIAMGDSWRSDFGTTTYDHAYFINTYNASVLGSLTTSWSITGDPTAGAKIGAVLARQTVEGFRRSLDVITGTIRGAYTTMPRVAIRDSNFTDEYGFQKKFFPLLLNLDARLNEWSGEWIECPATYTDSGLEWASSDYDTGAGPYTITANEIEVNEQAGDGTATFEDYTTVAGETIRLVLEMVDDGSSDIPSFAIEGDGQTVAWGTNRYTYRTAAATDVTCIIGGDDAGDNHNYTATLTIYGLTGV